MAKKDRYQVSLKLILHDDAGEILALAENKGSFAGYYDFPGGRIEVDEFETPLVDIVRREAREELGGEIVFDLGVAPVAVGRHRIPSDVDVSGATIPEIHVLYLFFAGHLRRGNVVTSEEHASSRWLSVAEIKKSPEKYFKSGNLEGIKMYLANDRPSAS
jgi:8-oxo-dGTP pyrophosphatase MutT (NUDIX family)